MAKSKDTRGDETPSGSEKPSDPGTGRAADEAVKAALDMAQSMDSEKESSGTSLLFGLGEYGDSVSISQYIEEAEERAQSLFAHANADDEGPLEELDVLDVAAEFGRPDESADDSDGTEVSVENPLALEETQNLSVTTPVRMKGPEGRGIGAEDSHGKHGEPPAVTGKGALGDTRQLEPIRPVRPRSGPGEHRPEDDASAAISAGVATSPSTAEDAPPRARVTRRMVTEKLSRITDGSYFEILEVPTDASKDEIERAFYGEMALFGEAEFEQQSLLDLAEQGEFIRSILEEAFDVLGDSSLRERYGRAIENGS